MLNDSLVAHGRMLSCYILTPRAYHVALCEHHFVLMLREAMLDATWNRTRPLDAGLTLNKDSDQIGQSQCYIPPPWLACKDIDDIL